jgi:hypothetical protein
MGFKLPQITLSFVAPCLIQSHYFLLEPSARMPKNKQPLLSWFCLTMLVALELVARGTGLSCTFNIHTDEVVHRETLSVHRSGAKY